MSNPKILVLDIETAPILSYVWKLFDNDVALNQIKSDWYVISWGAKWLDEPPSKLMYKDQRHEKDIENDKALLKGIWELLNEADIVITQNGVSFDSKKLNARFVMNGMKPPHDYKHIDTYRIAKKHFAFTSNKLEYMADKLNTKYKKLKHDKFPGFELWKAVLAGDKQAWIEMERYNKHDVLSLEELYHKLIPWDNSIDFNVYSDDHKTKCTCGSYDTIKKGFTYTKLAKYQQYHCRSCGKWSSGRENLHSKEKKQALRRANNV